jgi:hypothetical protein
MTHPPRASSISPPRLGWTDPPGRSPLGAGKSARMGSMWDVEAGLKNGNGELLRHRSSSGPEGDRSIHPPRKAGSTPDLSPGSDVRIGTFPGVSRSAAGRANFSTITGGSIALRPSRSTSLREYRPALAPSLPDSRHRGRADPRRHQRGSSHRGRSRGTRGARPLHGRFGSRSRGSTSGVDEGKPLRRQSTFTAMTFLITTSAAKMS